MFSKIDVRSGYHQLRIWEGSIPKKTFWTRYGRFEFMVMHIMLANVSGTFMDIMNNVFWPSWTYL